MKIAKLKIENYSRGYTLVELLFYIAFFSILSVVVIQSLVTMTRSFKETSIQAELVQSGTIIERISREIRQAYDISSISATNLGLASTDSAGANKTVEFLLSGTSLQLLENSVLTGNLNTPTIVVTDLSFTQITTLKGKAVKIALSFRSENDTLNRVQTFYDTVVLRNGYE